jgi:hypothetical protein
LTFLLTGFRPLRTRWLIVGNENLAFVRNGESVMKSMLAVEGRTNPEGLCT